MTQEHAPRDEPDFSSSYTENFPALLRELGVSLLISTYQAGKLIIVRESGDELNTHFRSFQSPMGIAFDAGRGRLAIGTLHEIWEFQNQAAVASKIDDGRCDAAFLPRRRHYSGDIRVHEIGWVDGELWAVNTRFSCLCTFDSEHSFVPRWRPPFVTGLAPEDRCHLNGMAVIDGSVRYVTCLGRFDTAGGWRASKASGGCLLDVPTGEPLITGLSMPHSPRRHGGRDWILESGVGALSISEPARGSTTEVVRMPGFTRGLDFHGPYAFVGLSQVRESAIFSGIPLVEKLPERACGVCVVDTRSGTVVAWLRFEGTVREIFAVQVLPGIRFPDLFNESGPEIASSFILPDDVMGDVRLS